jgi:entericidin B
LWPLAGLAHHWFFDVAGNVAVFAEPLPARLLRPCRQICNFLGDVMKKLTAILAVLLLGSALSACNTFRGAGQDIEKGGEKIQGAATTQQNK